MTAAWSRWPLWAFSGAGEHFNISDVDVTAGDIDTFGSGWSWGLRLGLTIQS